ncbi:MAG: hypothetical protein KDC61_21825, partial [Saprospiraceae bacterium]|nr:hypothetical protein [Saprospiraceae bacterium]
MEIVAHVFVQRSAEVVQPVSPLIEHMQFIANHAKPEPLSVAIHKRRQPLFFQTEGFAVANQIKREDGAIFGLMPQAYLPGALFLRGQPYILIVTGPDAVDMARQRQ